MHIVFCIASLGSGGAERAMAELANHYAQKGHTVSLITLVSPKLEPFYLLDPRIHLIQTNKSSTGRARFIKRIINVSSSLWVLRKIIKKLRSDVVISFIDLMNVRVLLACLGLDIPIIVSERTDPAYHALPFKKLSEWLRLKLYPNAHALVVQTQAAANYFPQAWHKKIKVIPNAVKKPKKMRKLNFYSIRNILTVGRLSIEKNHRFLIFAFSDWIKKYPDLILTIYGEGPERPNLEKLVMELSLEGKVRLPGTVQPIQEFLVKGDLFVFPSRYEGFPNALCEAMAIGLPVIASHCSGNAEVVQDGVSGILFPIDDRNALTEAVLDLIRNPHHGQTLAKRASAISDHYSPEAVYGIWDKLILENADADNMANGYSS